MFRKSLAVAVVLAAAAFAPAAEAKNVTVMTRNLYLGADLIPLATAPAAEFQQRAGQVFDSVVATDPNNRMKLVAAEIAKAKPDLVGLQEVSLWRTGTAPAADVVYDYSTTIMKELARRHAHYRLVTLKRGFNVEGPTDHAFGDVRLTLGDAILARKGVKVSHVRSRVFKTQLTIPTQGVGPVVVTRGWNQLDARLGKAKLHFVNTHLEAYSPTVREAQGKELVKKALKSKLKTVLVGDLNSGPDLSNPDDRLAYKSIARAGFKPERTAKHSCCFGDSLNTGGWDHNVDWILAKPKVKLVRTSLTGAETTAGGLHPSDHGGVVSTLRF